MKFKLIDGESGESRYVTLAEAKTWDWEIWRMIHGHQVYSWNRFLSMLEREAENNAEEVEILEAPRFIMVAG